jgi:hypothetical protein
MTSTLESVVETLETVTEVDVHGTLDEEPIKTHKSKKHVKDRNKAVGPRWSHQALINRPNAIVLTLLRTRLRVSPGETRCVHRPSEVRTRVPPSPKGIRSRVGAELI